MVSDKFRVHPLPGKVSRTRYDYLPRQIQTGEVTLASGKTEKQYKTVRDRVEVQFEEPAGFLVVTTRGDAIRVRDEQELARLGFNRTAPLVDTDTGEEIPRSEIGFMNQGMPLESLVHGYIPSEGV